MTTQFAYNRSSNSFLYEIHHVSPAGKSVPTTTVVSDGQKMWIRDLRPVSNVSNPGKNQRVPDSVVELSLDQPLNYASLTVDNPVIGKDFLPHLALLMGEDLVTQVAKMGKSRGSLQASVEPLRGDDPRKRTGLKTFGWPDVSRFFKTITYWVDPKTNLITQVTLERDSADQLGILDVEIQSHNKPLDPSLFKYDTTGLKKFGSLRESRGLK